MIAFASLFGGFGGVDIAARAAGMELAWSVELDAAVAEVARANLRHRVHVADILDCDPMRFDAVDVLHASPPCTNASVANAQGGETALDRALARKVAAFVTTLQPHIFTLENVWGYRKFLSWRLIEEALHRAGYWVSVEHVNAADAGVPQTRKRMIVRAVRGGFVPYLPEPQPWVGWYAAVEDLIPTLPESRFADWQMARLPSFLASTLVGSGGYDGKVVTAQERDPAFTVTENENQLVLRAFLVGDQERQIAMEADPAFTVRAGGNGGAMPKAFLLPGGGNTNFAEAHAGKGCRYEDEPAHTVVATSKEGGAFPRAWLVDGANTTEGQLSFRDDSQPALTVTSGGPKHPLRSLLNTGRVVAMTVRALARFQSFPDQYCFSGNARLDARGIGNAVPPLLYQRIIASLVERI